MKIGVQFVGGCLCFGLFGELLELFHHLLQHFLLLKIQKNDVAFEEIEVVLDIEEELLIGADFILLPLDNQLKFLEEEVRVVLM